MRRRRSELGEGQGGCIVGLIFLALVIFLAWKFVPVKVRTAEMRQTVIDEAKMAGTHKDPRIRRIIMEKAADLDIPLEDENLIIRRRAQTIYIEATYTIPIEFPGFTYEWNIEHKAENPIF